MSPEKTKKTATPKRKKTGTKAKAAGNKGVARKSPKKTDNKNVGHVFSGDLTLRRISEIKEEFSNLISGNDDVRLSLENIEDIDLSFIQVLCASHRTIINDGKTMVLTGNLPEVFRKLTLEAGLDRHIGCSLNGDVLCPWLENKEN